MITPRTIVEALTAIKLPDCFNPYTDRDPLHDRPNAPVLRRNNLLFYLEHYLEHKPSEIWLAESGSHTGTRRSGLPLVPTTEVEALNARFATSGFTSPTLTSDRTGMTAGYVWEAALTRPRLPLFWNAVMAHPHRPGAPYRNRPTRRTELTAYQPVLGDVLQLFDPVRILAIGRIAARMLEATGSAHYYVRHPAQGGAREFREGVAKHYG